jgi:hypothetical protein
VGYVNPTGPLTVGHGRGAVIGDTLANLLEVAGLLRGDDGLVKQRSKLFLDHDRLTAHILASGCNS